MPRHAHGAFLSSIVCAVVLGATLDFIFARTPADPIHMNQDQEPPSPSENAADLVLTNGRIYTVDLRCPWATRIAIRGGWIVAVSDASDAANAAEFKSLIGPNTRVIDLHGQFAMPGFNDAHVHLAAAGYAKREVNLEGTQSLAEFQQRIRNRLGDYKPGEWITGRGWDHTLWSEKRFPTRQDLDAVSAGSPMIFSRVDGHVAVVNSLALTLVGITRDTPDPAGGRIVRDLKTGEPTGMLEEDSATDLVYSCIPPAKPTERRRAIELALDEASQFGVTSVQDNSVQSTRDKDNFGWDNFLTLAQMQREGRMKVRVTEWLPFDAPLERLEEMRNQAKSLSGADSGGHWLKTGALKEFLDGSLGSRTAAMLTPYSDDPTTTGILRIDPARLTEMAIERDRAGFQLTFHAIGDRANRVALDTYAAVVKANGPRERRDRIEHAQVVASADFARFAQLNVTASMQPSHLLDDARWATDRLGRARSRGAYAWHTMERNGVHLAFGTDYPVESINPLRGLYACVTRDLPEGGPKSDPQNGSVEGWQPQERLPMDQCIRAYTVGSAYAEFEESRKGTIAPGMLADIVVFPADLTRIPAHDLLTMRPAMTIVAGRIVSP
jgi:predicted amidohydrolase YtcJ